MRRIKSGLMIASLVFAGIFLFSSVSEAVIIFVSPRPTRVRLNAKAGAQASGEIEVSNPTDKPVNMRAYVEDYIIDENGAPSYLAKGSTPRSSANWTEIYPETFQIPPKEKVKVRYSLTVPANANGTYYSVVFFESFGEKGTFDKGVKVGVDIVARIGTHIALMVDGTIKRELTDFNLVVTPPKADKPLTITYSFKNSGNVDIASNGDFSIVDASNNFFGKGTYQMARAMGGSIIKGKAEYMGELPPGKYTLISTFQIGPDEPQEVVVKETEFEIK